MSELFLALALFWASYSVKKSHFLGSLHFAHPCQLHVSSILIHGSLLSKKAKRQEIKEVWFVAYLTPLSV
jgi:hypothetical protein